MNTQESSYRVRMGTVAQARQVTRLERFFNITLDDGELAHRPGQFVMIGIPGVGEVPISISSSPTKKGSFDLVVRNAGMVTARLHTLDTGSRVYIRGPLGNGFPCETLEGNDIIFVTGGLGLVPARSLIQYVLDNRRDYGMVHILLGCKTPQDMLFADEIKEWDAPADVVCACTVDRADPDWKGNVGLITALIPGVTVVPDKTYAVVVGPPIMYKFVIAELLAKNIAPERIILSLERHMKCGVGKCGHCQIADVYCCQDGPVFTYAQLKGNYEAL